MDELRVPTVAVPVQLAVLGRATSTTELFLHEQPARTSLIDTLAALLDEDSSFIPVRNDGKVRLLRKGAIAWLAVPAEAEQDQMTLYDRQNRVEVELTTGLRLPGVLLYSGPIGRTRVVDHLNATKQFVRLWTAEAFFLINMEHILQITERPDGSDR